MKRGHRMRAWVPSTPDAGTRTNSPRNDDVVEMLRQAAKLTLRTRIALH